MLDSIYHMSDIKINKKSLFCRENVKIFTSFLQRYNEHHYVKLLNILMVYRFYCMALYHSQTGIHWINS